MKSKKIGLILIFSLLLSCVSIPQVTAETPRQLWAVVVGCDGEASEHLDNDAQDFVDVLTSIYGFPSDHVMLLLNSEATHTGVVNALTWLGEQEQRPDGVTIFFSAHGGMNHVKLYNGDWITDSEISNFISSYDSHNIFVLINSCLSGTFIDVADVIDSGVLITACREDELTYDISIFSNTIFVQYFLESLSGDVSVQDAFNYAYSRCSDPPGALTPTHPQMIDKYGEGFNLGNPVHAPWFTNLMAIVAITIFGYALKKKKIGVTTDSMITE